MRRPLFCLAAVAAWLPLAGAQPQAIYRPATLAVELRRLQSAIGKGSATLDSLPAAWEVETPGRRYSISTEPLRRSLAAGRQDKGDSSRREAITWLDMLARQLEGSEAPAPSAMQRARLDRILARREFAGVGPPSAFELWRRRIMLWFEDLIRRFFSVMAAHPTTSQLLFWIVIAGCVGFLAVWLVRWWTRDQQIPGLPRPDPSVAPVRDWEAWLREAHRAAAAGDWRQAIHAAYWAAVGRLQQTGALPKDLTHTPREYLRMVSEQTAQSSLASLTGGLERFWYARRTARPEDFRESLNRLEALGCKVE